MRIILLYAATFVAIHALPVDPDIFDADGFCFTNGAMGSNLYTHPKGCEKYIMCLKMNNFVSGWTFKCSPETYFSQQTGGCIHITDGVSCINHPDLKKATCTLGDDSYVQESQNSYTKTDVNGVVTPGTCNDDYSYFNIDTCTCDNDDLTATQCILKSDLYTIYESIVPTAQQQSYKMINRRTEEVTVNACPKEMPVFSVAECACVDPIPVKLRSDCNLYDMETTNSLYMELHEVTIEAGKAHFAGTYNSYFSLPFYAGNDFRNKLGVQFKFKNLVAGATEYIHLLQNDVFDIAVTSDMVRITLLTSDTGADEPCKLEASFPPSIQVFPIDREILVKYDGKNLKSEVSGIDIGSASCTGNVVSAGPVTVGRGFKGTIDDLMLCKSV